MAKPRAYRKALGEKVFQQPAEYVFQIQREEWREEAVCAQIDPETWFPVNGSTVTAQVARKFCRTCPVQLECLTEALEQDERHGVWGGLSERDRRPLHSAVNAGADPKDAALAQLHGQEALRSWAG